MKKNNEFYNELKQLVAFPSISSDPGYRESLFECASYLQGKLENIHAETKMIETKGYPLIVAKIERNPLWPTIAIYNHYDVQPIAEPDKWESDPFVLRAKNGKYFGRGASDNKGNLLIALKAVERALEHDIALNFEFIYEGEEESGSPNFKEGMYKAKKFLNPDSIIVADAGWVSKDQPSIIYGLRGLLYMHWDLKTGDKSMHSGGFGGAVRNPVEELMQVVVKCHDSKTGRILIPGVYEKVKEPDKEEVKNWMDVDIDAEKLIKIHKLTNLRVKDKVSLLKALWAMPTFEVHGCIGGYMKKDGRMTVIPPEAQLLVSMRLVLDQKPEEIFELVTRYVAKLNPDIEVKMVSAANPYVGDYNSKEIRNASQSLKNCFGFPVVKIRMGGSIGAVVDMHDILGKPQMLLMSFGLPEYGTHGPNEYFEQKQADRGISAFLNYFKLMEGTL